MARMIAPPAIVILGTGALETARRIQDVYRRGNADVADAAADDAAVAGCQVHALQGRVEADVSYTELGVHLCELYARGTPIVALCAAGIVIRCLAPMLSNKGVEPPVLVVAEDGSAVVPLLGGLAGVNVMAREIAAALAVQPAITTSGELRFGTCVLNPPDGYALADIGQGKRFVSDLLAGESTRIEGDAPWLDDARLPRSGSARLAIRVTPHVWDGREDELVIHPRSVVAAVTGLAAGGRSGGAANGTARASDTATANVTANGRDCDCNATTDHSGNESDNRNDNATTSASAHQIVARIRESLDAHRLAALSLAALLASSGDMTDPALAEAAAILGVPLRFTPPRSGDRASPASLLQAALRIPYQMLHGDAASCVALAIAPLAIDPGTIGCARGRLTVIGLGPGSADLMVPAARTALNEATDILGYDTYVKMAGPLRADQRVHGTDNREEMQRARHAFELASEGRSVVMVSSGDPGVFAMAAAVLEALDEARVEAHAGATGEAHTEALVQAQNEARVEAHAEVPVQAQSEARMQAPLKAQCETPAQPQAQTQSKSLLKPRETHALTYPAWSTVELTILPGVSAAMATAAQAGAPLGHDFCMLSLSDNLKPWSIIETRLRHAAEADLVMAFYNPISRARPWQLDKAFDIVREHRPAHTLVVLGRDIGRPGGTLRTLTLGEVRSSDVDMRTMVIVGSSTTRRFSKGPNEAGEWVYTPRWYR